MRNSADITGLKFGKLTALKRVSNDKYGHAIWLCECECGNQISVLKSSLTTGRTRSCGCLFKQTRHTAAKTHGQSKTRLFGVWVNMHERCENPHRKDWRYYGGKGVKVCDEWSEFTAFAEWATRNGYSDNLTIDRVDVNGGYNPDNCRWVSWEKQMNNTTRNRRITADGKTLTLAEWAKESGIKYRTLQWRLSHGWDERRSVIQVARYK